jgi:hypothetical protein
MRRPPDVERRQGPERRLGVERRTGIDRRRDRDRAIARTLPDEFAQAGGGAVDRITGLVNRHWLHRSGRERADLAAVLLPVLENLAESRTPVTDQHRDRCEAIVVRWIASVAET